MARISSQLFSICDTVAMRDSFQKALAAQKRFLTEQTQFFPELVARPAIANWVCFCSVNILPIKE